MPELADHLAELTSLRDRDQLDATLAGVLRDLLDARTVTVSRPVGDGAGRRWLTRARLEPGDVVPSADSIWTDPDKLPPLDAFADRCLALDGGVVTHADGRCAFPLSSDREVVGVLEVELPAELDAASRRLVCGVLRIYRNFQSLLDYSERDTLTGLLNRKTFDETFFKAFGPAGPVVAAGPERRGAAQAQRLWLGMIDIDFFKAVNDNHGHQIGDEVLLLVSRLMQASFRYRDRLYRFGGEEFVVLLRCDSKEEAARAFERLRANTEAYAFPQVGRVTLSVGFTEVVTGDSPSSAIARADQAVYFGKAHGRNQVHNHADLVARGQIELSEKVGEVELF